MMIFEFPYVKKKFNPNKEILIFENTTKVDRT